MDDSTERRLRETFAQRLQIERRNASLTQEELAARTGRSVDLISRLERGTSGPSFETIARLAEALDVPAGALLMHGTPKQGRRATELDELVDLVLATPPSAIKRLKQVVKAFLR